MLKAIDLKKTFTGVEAVDGLDITVKPGQIFALLGPNGAGKTTTLRMIMNIIKPDAGEIYLDDIPRNKIPQRKFGYLPEERGVYQRATVLNMLIYFGTLNNLSKHKAEIEAIRQLDKFGLIDYTQSRIVELSKGMQQKIQFIISILHNPDILILDEPFIGLDPINQMAFTELIKKFRDEGKYIILSSHQMDQVEKLSDYICLMNHGKVILDGKISAIKKQFQENSYYIESDEDLSNLKDFAYLDILEQKNNGMTVNIKNINTNLKKFTKILFESFIIRKFEIIEPTLHDIFIKLIRKENNNGKKN